MNKICFVSYEIHPTTWGGAGVLLHNAANRLLQTGHEVVLLLDVTDDDFKKFINDDRPNFLNPDHCRAYQVDSLCRDISPDSNQFPNLFIWKSYRFYYALRKVVLQENPDLVEFFDYSGAAYHSLSAKIAGLAFTDTPITIRLHTSNTIMDRYQPRKLDPEYYIQYGLEHHALQLAETVIYPSEKYLQDAYKPHFKEKWLGNIQKSSPPLLYHPGKASRKENKPGSFLFYGRLYGIKGVDVFIHAAVALLEQNPDIAYRFYLVGHDSFQPPTVSGGESYQSYLLQQIPAKFRNRFVFTGVVSWRELEILLQDVLAAVFPSYFESFCYAAHELYAAGVPILVNNIPAFQDSFKDSVNALVYDGSTQDLMKKMASMADPAIRQSLSCPYPITDVYMDGFYEKEALPGWMMQQEGNTPIELTTCVLLDKPHGQGAIQEIGQNLKQALPEYARLFFFQPVQASQNQDGNSFWWLGDLYHVFDENGKSISPYSIFTSNTILILRSTDHLLPDFGPTAVNLLFHHPQIAFVGGWHEHNQKAGKKAVVSTVPLDAMLERLPFITTDPLNRCIMRTQPGQLLMDLFDSRTGIWGELQYLWKLDDGEHPGIILPETVMKINGQHRQQMNKAILSYLILSDDNPSRKEKIALLAAAMASDAAHGWKPGRIHRVEMRHKISSALYNNPVANQLILRPLMRIWNFYKNKAVKKDALR
jgi:glycosyltransferase involved in cell wall biosynthesis